MSNTNDGLQPYQQKMLEVNKAILEDLEELHNTNKEVITAFFDRLKNGRIRGTDEFKIDGVMFSEITSAVEVLSKNIDVLQELTVTSSILKNSLERFIYKIAINEASKPENNKLEI